MKKLLFIACLFVLLSVLYSCKKGSSTSPVSVTASYTADTFHLVFNGTWSASSPPASIGLTQDSIGYLETFSYPNLGGDLSIPANFLVFSFHFPFNSSSLVQTGTYTYQLPTPNSKMDSANAMGRGWLMYNTGQVSNPNYLLLLSDTLTINSITNHYFISGTFQATYLNKFGGDSIIHVSNGLFSNFALMNAEAVPPSSQFN